MNKPKVLLLTATCGRHTCLERSVRFFLDQDYDGEHTLLIYNNSNISQELGNIDVPNNKKIILINNHIYSKTGTRYQTLGAIYDDAVKHIPEDIELVNFADDDDIYLPNHITEGVKGYLKYGKSAYKPFLSYFRHSKGISLVANNMEPSVFVKRTSLLEHGFKDTTTDQHLQWYGHLCHIGDIEINKDGTPTLCYNWGDTNIPTFKTSGNPGNPENFENYRNYSQDHGDFIITPCDPSITNGLYDQILNSKIK